MKRFLTLWTLALAVSLAHGQNAVDLMQQLYRHCTDAQSLKETTVLIRYFNDTAATVPVDTMTVYSAIQGGSAYYRMGNRMEGLNANGYSVQVLHDDREMYVVHDTDAVAAVPGLDWHRIDTLIKTGYATLYADTDRDRHAYLRITTRDPALPEVRVYYDAAGPRVIRTETYYLPEAVWDETPALARVETVYLNERTTRGSFPAAHALTSYVTGSGSGAKPAPRYAGYRLTWSDPLPVYPSHPNTH